jgi:hypothetical protein
MTQALWPDDDDDDVAIDEMSILLAAWEIGCDLDDDELDILKRPWRHSEEDHANVMAKVRWGDVKNEEARELIQTLNEPWTGWGEARVKHIINTLEETPTELFWPVFIHTRQGCRGAWRYRKKLLQMLRHHAEQEPAINYMRAAASEFFDRLPPVVTVFRGSSPDCVRGLSWTTTREIAERFATNPSVGILATALIDKRAIFAVCSGEDEIIVDPDHLRELRLIPISAARAPTD